MRWHGEEEADEGRGRDEGIEIAVVVVVDACLLLDRCYRVRRFERARARAASNRPQRQNSPIPMA